MTMTDKEPKKQLTAKEYIVEQIAIFNPMKESFLKDMETLDLYTKRIHELCMTYEVSEIDAMRELGVEFREHMKTMKTSIAKMSVFSELVTLKYKEYLRKEIDDKFDCIDKAKLMYASIFNDVEMWRDIIERNGRLYTELQWTIKSLLWDKRSWEYMNLN